MTERTTSTIPHRRACYPARVVRRAFLLLSLSIPALACTPKVAPGPALDPRQAAEARRLLQSYADAMQQFARSGNPVVAAEVFEEMKDTVARADVPEGFSPRFRRLLEATLAAFEPDRGAATQTLDAFVKSVRGPDATVDPNAGVARHAEVFVEELVALRLTIDPDMNAEDVKAAYFPDA